MKRAKRRAFCFSGVEKSVRSIAIQVRPDIYWPLGGTAEAEWGSGFLTDNFAFSPETVLRNAFKVSQCFGFSYWFS
jgi:hypothetical protein